MTDAKIVPDLEMAQLFLDTFEPSGKFTFLTFDDNQDRKDWRLRKTLHGTLVEHAATLRDLQKKGAGVFVTINETDLNGRKEENVVRVRSVFVDLDGAPIEPVLEHQCEPHMVIESSKERWHAYWLSELPLDQFRGMQKNLAQVFNGDSAICDLPRVMRLPGFFHHKRKNGKSKKPFMTRIESITEDTQRYSAEQLCEYFPEAPQNANGAKFFAEEANDRFAKEQLEDLLGYIDPSDRTTWIAVGHALKAISQDNLDLFLDFSEGKFWGKPPANFVSRSDVIKTWTGMNPNRSGVGALIKLARENGYLGPGFVVKLTTGSQVEVAKLLCSSLEENYSFPIHTEGNFWSYSKTHWQQLDPTEVRQLVQTFDGARYRKSKLKLSKQFIDGVIHEAATMLAKPDFFTDAPHGANMLNGFICITTGGNVEVLEHNPEHRQRYCLKYEYEASKGVTFAGLLDKLFTGCFGYSAEEYGELILQIIGSAICGINTSLKEPKAFVLYGYTAANGKSTIQEIVRRIIPSNLICSIPPGDMDREQYLAKLLGKSVNLSDELSNAAAVASDKLKAVVTGDPVTAKIIYREPIEFKPTAVHVFSTNVLPSFKGGVDAGIERRLLVIPFSRSIPVEERITDLETKLMEEQGGTVISEAIRQAAIVLKNGAYTIPSPCKDATEQWMREADPIKNWLEDGGLMRAIPPHVPKLFNEVYVYFSKDMDEIGVKHVPGLNRFNGQVRAFIADDPSWEEVRLATGKHLRRSNLVTRMNKKA